MIRAAERANLVWRGAVVAVGLVCVGALPAAAQIDTAITRGQSNAIQRAISNTLQAVIYPKLTIRNPIGGRIGTVIARPEQDSAIVLLDDGTSRVWNLGMGIEARRVVREGEKLRAASNGGERGEFLFGTEQGRLLGWNEQNDAWSAPRFTADGPIEHIRTSADGSAAVVATRAGKLSLVPLRGGAAVALGDAGERLNAVAVQANGKAVAAVGASGKFMMWAQGAAFGELASGRGATVVAALAEGGFVAGDAKGGIAVWRAGADGVFAPRALAAKHGGAVTAIAGVPGGKQVVSAAADKSLLVSDSETGAVAGKLMLEGAAQCLAVERTGRRAMACGQGGVMDVVDLQNGKTVGQMMETAAGWAVTDAIGRFDGSFSGMDDLEFVAAKTKLPLDHFGRTYFEPGLLAELMNPALRPSTPSLPPLASGVAGPPVASVKLVGQPGADQADIEVTATAAKGGVKEVRIAHNGRGLDVTNPAVVTVVKQERSSRNGGGQMVAQYRVKLSPGRNRFTVQALGDSPVDGVPADLEIATPAAGGGKPTLRLLSVGIDRYNLKDLQLSFATADAKGIADTLRTRAPRELGAPVVETLFDGAATFQAITAALDRLKGAAPEDTVVIYLAGHGIVVNDQWYYLPADLPTVSDTEISHYGISVARLQAYLGQIGALRVALIIDACYSGSAAETISRSIAQRNLWVVGNTEGVHVLAATDKDTEAPEFKSLGHGALTYALLQGMSGAVTLGPGDVLVRNLMAYAQTSAPRLAQAELERTQRGARASGALPAVTRLPVPTVASHGIDFAVARGK